MIDWCSQHITAYNPEYKFFNFDIKSAYQQIDGQIGNIDATVFRFPFENDSFDSVLLASVFTHMPMQEIRSYLREVHRILGTDGKVLLSVFFSSDGSQEVRGADFFLIKRDFLDIVSKIGFDSQFILELSGHNWFCLTKK